jgi:nucleoside-diphosphate-sugar epimerase
MKVFVTGATGVIGRRAVAQLVAAGHEVRAVSRSAEKDALVRSLGAEPVSVSLFDVEALTAAMAGHDAVANLATKIPTIAHAALPGAWDENNRIRSEGSAALVDAAIAAGVGRFIQESITFTYPDSGDAWIDAASTAIDPPTFGASVAEAEASTARFTANGGTGIVLRFGIFYAADAAHTQSMVNGARRGVSVVAGRPDAYQSMIHADDAAAAVVAALGAPAGTYDVVDDEPLTKRAAAEVLGGVLRIPGSMAKLGGSYAEIMVRSQRVSNQRFKDATGWSPRFASFRTGLPAVLEELASVPRPPLVERLVRPILALLAVIALQLGVWITISPTNFYENFPGFGRTWVSVDGPYNEHLLRDFGQGQLVLAAVLIAAALRPERYLVRVAALASLLFAVPHLAYHATHLDVYDTTDQVINVVALVLAVVLPAVLVLGSARRSGSIGSVAAPWEPSGSSSPQSSAPSPA